MRTLHLTLALTVFCLFSVSSASADEFEREIPEDLNDPELVFAYQGDAVLTQDGIDAAFSRIPKSHRLPFIRDGAKVDKMVRDIMKTEVIANDALEKGFDEDPVIRERMLLAAHKTLAEAWVEEIAAQAPEADFAAMAYEDYVANPEDYQTPEYIDVTHILISTETRTDADALALAQSVREQALESPQSFTELVLEYSDDPGKERNKGRYLRVGPGQMVKPFERAAFALESEGDISKPVGTEYGFHIIRLDKRYAPRQKPFEEVREEAIAKMEQRHRSKYQENYIKGLLEEGIVLPEGSVEVMLKRYFGDNLENAPQY